MRISDILGMSLSNLWRRKTRTVLTVLGVIIGTTSIVVMLSLGIGLKASMMEEVGTAGGLTQINVYTEGYYDGENASENLMLDDAAVEDFLNLEHVDSVEPRLEFDMPIQAGKYESYAMIYGVSEEYLKEIELGEGEIPKGQSGCLELVAGNQVLADFYDWNTGEYPYYESEQLPDVDLLRSNVIGGIEIMEEEVTEEPDSNKDDGSLVEGGSIFGTEEDEDDDEDSDAIPQDNFSEDTEGMDEFEFENDTYSYTGFGQDTKRVSLKVTGITKGDMNTYTEYSYYYYTTIDQLRKFLKDNYPENVLIPGQPTDRNGKPYRDLKYSNLIVNVDTSENVEDVLQTIQDMGYRADANKEWLEEVEKQFLIIEAVLGGIGSVAMLVAAISIANTMTMSTYERTKEIGVMKVLGCKLSNIRAMFLSEAAFIGFLGGVIGIGLSFLLSAAVNRLAPALMEMGLASDAQISVIPFWLILLAVVFSTVIGMLAGFFPAQRAMKLSPLNAIRNE